MSFEIRPPGVPGGPDATPPVPRGSSQQTSAVGRFARVYELEEARRRRAADLQPIAGDRIPAEVWDEVDRASRLFDQMQADGRRVMFDTDRLTGSVVASLLEPDGATSPVQLGDAVDPSALAQRLNLGLDRTSAPEGDGAA
jgi:hypothetical protein